MRKYGTEHFHIELIEETDSPEEREIYWIEQYHSFKNGYNATLGGDGKKYIDYDLVVSTYKELSSIVDTAKQLGISQDCISSILHSRSDVKVLSAAEVYDIKYRRTINQYDKDSKAFIQTFPSARAAAQSVTCKEKSAGASYHITEVCKGKRKSAYGYFWQFAS